MLCYIVVECLTQRTFQGLLEPFRLANTVQQIPFFIDGYLETHAHHTSFFLYQVCLIQKPNLKQSWIALFVRPAYDIRQCILMYVYIHRHTYVYIYKPHLNDLYLCFPSLLPS